MRLPRSSAAPRLRPPAKEDALLCAALAVAWVFDAVLHEAVWWLFPIACAAVLGGRRRRPVAVALVLVVVTQFAYAFGTSGTIPYAGRITPAVAAVVLGQYLPSSRGLAIWITGVCGYLFASFFLWGPAPSFDGRWAGGFVLAVVVPVVGAVLGGRLSFESRRRLGLVLGREEALRREQRLLVDRAAQQERDRIAGDMHDIIGHRVGNIVMLATALDATFRQGEADVPGEAELIRSEGRAALRELRTAIRAMEGTAEEEGTQGLNDLDHLVDVYAKASHTSVRLDVDGHPDLLPAGLQTALRRMIQEGLANAAKHAPGAPVDLCIVCARDGVRLTITNGGGAGVPPPEVPGEGRGLAGARARAAALGGTFQAGALPDGGFRIEGRFPLRPPGADS